MLLFQLLNSFVRSEAIAENVFQEYCDKSHGEYNAYKLAYHKVNLLGHYYDFSAAPPLGAHPGYMGFYRVYVTWVGTTTVTVFKGRPF